MNSKVAYLGPDWTYSHLAACQFQPESKPSAPTQTATDRNPSSCSQANSAEVVSVTLTPCETIDDVFATILSGQADCGLVPIHNSMSGLVIDTAESILRRLLGIRTVADQSWWQQPLCISGNLFLQVEHCLVGFGTPQQIQEVTSKQQALDQCQQWLKCNLPEAKLTTSDSSAAALPSLIDDPTKAAISSRQAAEAANIPIVQCGIQDASDNITEFVVVQRDDIVGYTRYPNAAKELSEFWIQPQNGTRSNDQPVHWSCDFQFAGQSFRCFKIGSQQTFSEGQAVTTELPAETMEPQTNKRGGVPSKDRMWRLGIA